MNDAIDKGQAQASTPGVGSGETVVMKFGGTSVAGPDDLKFQFGAPNRIPVVGDWDGDGDLGIGVFNPATGR